MIISLLVVEWGNRGLLKIIVKGKCDYISILCSVELDNELTLQKQIVRDSIN